MGNASFADIFFDAGCRCRLDDAMSHVCRPDADGRIRSLSCVKDALCSERCPARSLIGFVLRSETSQLLQLGIIW